MKRNNRQKLTVVAAQEKLETVSDVLVGLRRKVIDARSSSGIEAVWLSCEESYIGIDDANRHEFSGARWAKPMNLEGPLTKELTARDNRRSTIFVPLTARYVNHASAKLSEIILPIDDRPFSLKADLVANDVRIPIVVDAQSQEKREERDLSRINAAKRNEERIADWLIESKYPREARKAIKDAARIGTGVIKGPIPETRKDMVLRKPEKGVTQISIDEKIYPCSKRVDPWNIFPDESCGEDVHDGEYIFERDYLSRKALQKLKDEPHYITEAIDQVLKEGPGKQLVDSNPHERRNIEKKRFEVWHFYGWLKRDQIENIMSSELFDTIGEEEDDVPVIAALVNDTIIRVVINPFDTGEFPYRVMNWSMRDGSPFGIGIGEQIQSAQKIVNGATRALLNNAGLSAGVQLILDQLGIQPADGEWVITPDKLWYRTGESMIQDVRASIQAIQIPNVTVQMMTTIEYGMKLAEESSNIPLVTMGADSSSPQTFGQAELQDTNAHVWLRQIAEVYDDSVTEPLIDAYYRWLLMDPEIDDDDKLEFKIIANGSRSMVERSIQEQTFPILMQMAVQMPTLRYNPERLGELYLKSKRLDPRVIQYTDDEWAKVLESQQGQKAPAVQVAEIRANAMLQGKQFDLQGKGQMAQLNAQLGMAATQQEAQLEAQLAQLQPGDDQNALRIHLEQIRSANALQIEASRQQLQREEMASRERLLMLEYSLKQNMTLEQVKAELAKTAMIERTRKELANAELSFAATEGDKNRNVSVIRDEVSTKDTP